MIQILKGIADIFYTLINIVVSTLQAIAVLIVNIPHYITFLVNSLNLLPDVVIPFLLISIYIYVMYIIVGRSTN